MNLLEYLGPWIYWPLAIAAISGSVTWTLNCVSVTYSEVGRQIAELARVKSAPRTPEILTIERPDNGV